MTTLLVHPCTAKCAAAKGLGQSEIPCCDAPRTYTLTLPHMPSRTCALHGLFALKAYQAALRNLADALETYQSVTDEVSGNMQRVPVFWNARIAKSSRSLSELDRSALVQCGSLSCALSLRLCTFFFVFFAEGFRSRLQFSAQSSNRVATDAHNAEVRVVQLASCISHPQDRWRLRPLWFRPCACGHVDL